MFNFNRKRHGKDLRVLTEPERKRLLAKKIEKLAKQQRKAREGTRRKG